MAELIDLGVYRQQLTERIQQMDLSDCVLPQSFKDAFTSFGEYQIEAYYTYSFKVTSKKSVCYVPNQWVAIASICSLYHTALMEYKNKVKALGVSDDVLEACHPSSNNTEAQRNDESLKEIAEKALENYHGENKDLLVRFLWDYDWWGGGKNIKRSNDWTQSPVLNIANAINSSSSLIGAIAAALADNPSTRNVIVDSTKEIHISTPLRMNKMAQKIFYGAPGSGKSFAIKNMLENIPSEQVYRTTFHPDTDYASFVGCYKPIVETAEDGEEKISYKFVPQVFTNAYVRAWQHPDEDCFLVIEEINRGNCAQIFGDLFQLLDRNEQGMSEYPINADVDLNKFLVAELGEDAEGIKDGKLCLPSNLHILATMNTSDQSLFPMDSAFKRRWSWQYVPIDYRNPKSSHFTIEIGGHLFRWVSFLEKINQLILKNTDSEDKQMGDFFIKQNVNEEEFKGKVMFYLWSEVCKDNYNTPENFFLRHAEDGSEKQFSFNELYSNKATNYLLDFMDILKVEEIEASEEIDEDDEDDEFEEDTADGIKRPIRHWEVDGHSCRGMKDAAKYTFERYLEKVQPETFQQILDDWDYKFVRRTPATYTQQYDFELRGEQYTVYIRRYWAFGVDGGNQRFEPFIDYVKEHFDIEIEEMTEQ